MNFRRISTLLLAALLMLACIAPGSAEGADQVNLMEVKIGSNTYCFSAPVEEFEAQGITIDNPEEWLSSATDGHATFTVFLGDAKGVSGDRCVCGVEIRPDGKQTFEVYGGLVIGPEPVTREQVRAVFGKTVLETDASSTYVFYHNLITYRMAFNEDNTLRGLRILSEIPETYGFKFSDPAGKADENLPDPKTMAPDEYIIDGRLYKGQITLQDLMDDGWVPNIDLNKELDPWEESSTVCYNGRGVLQMECINTTWDGPLKLPECGLYIEIDAENQVDVVLANGVTLGSPYADAVAAFGAPKKIVENHYDEGYCVYGHTTYAFSVRDNVVQGIAIMH